MRDPDRIPIILAALERHWRKAPDQRLGQVLLNLVRTKRAVDPQDEGRALFDVEDGDLLAWLGPENDAERRYIQEDQQERQKGWEAELQQRDPGASD